MNLWRRATFRYLCYGALLGARPIICGVGAALARSMVAGDFQQLAIAAARDLADGIALALAHLETPTG